MLTEGQVLKALQPIMDPDVGLSMVELGLVYGVDILDTVREADGADLEPVPGTETLWVELRWAAREGCVHLDDILLRRTRLGLLAPSGCLDEADRIKDVVCQETGWDEDRWQAEIKAYADLWGATHSPGLYP